MITEEENLDELIKGTFLISLLDRYGLTAQDIKFVMTTDGEWYGSLETILKLDDSSSFSPGNYPYYFVGENFFIRSVSGPSEHGMGGGTFWELVSIPWINPEAKEICQIEITKPYRWSTCRKFMSKDLEISKEYYGSADSIGD